jgi:hypothetical protein
MAMPRQSGKAIRNTKKPDVASLLKELVDRVGWVENILKRFPTSQTEIPKARLLDYEPWPSDEGIGPWEDFRLARKFFNPTGNDRDLGL